MILAALPLMAMSCSDEPKMDVVCWGDSLTAPSHTTLKSYVGAKLKGRTDYPTQLQEELGSAYNIINCGVGGENTLTIMARQGAAPMKLAHDVTVYNDKERKYPMIIGNSDIPTFISSWDKKTTVTPLVQFGYEESSPAKVNPCMIKGREYELVSDSKLWLENGNIKHNIIILSKIPHLLTVHLPSRMERLSKQPPCTICAINTQTFSL